MTRNNRYLARGVSAQKEEVHAAVRGADAGLYPSAFCKVVPDTLTGDTAHCLVMHADGAGTKAALAYLMYRETGDAGVFRGLAQDALVMNSDDLLCVGALGPYLVSNTLGRHKQLVPGEAISEILGGYRDLATQFTAWDMPVVLTGGETADVGDVVRTLIVDATAVARMARCDVIANDGVRPGHVIIGLASDGQTTYETTYNSGIGSNGLTSARHDLLCAEYAQHYPESFDPQLPTDLRYAGPYRLNDPLPGTPQGCTIGEALGSPTRTFAPVIRDLLAEVRGAAAHRIGALVHCTGGGQSKVLRTGAGLHYIKDNLFPLPPVFAEIRRVTQAPWAELYQVFNMGHRMEIIGEANLVPILEEIGAAYRLGVRVVGHVKALSAEGHDGHKNRLSLIAPDGERVVYHSAN